MNHQQLTQAFVDIDDMEIERIEIAYNVEIERTEMPRGFCAKRGWKFLWMSDCLDKLENILLDKKSQWTKKKKYN